MINIKGNPYRGFSLLELLVSVSIMTIMSMILLSNYPDSNIRIKLATFTQTVGLLFREVQIRGSAIDSQYGNFAGYGVRFDTASSTKVFLYGDKVIPGNYANGILIGDGLMDLTTNDELKSITEFPAGYRISEICIISNGTYYCGATTTPAITSLSISFIRPNPQPLIYVNDATTTQLFMGGIAVPSPYSGICIELSSPKAPRPGHVRSIRMEGIGFITTKVKGCE